jgi:hypothetical protein
LNAFAIAAARQFQSDTKATNAEGTLRCKG